MKRITGILLFLFTFSLLFTTSTFAYSKNNISKVVNVLNNGKYYSIGDIRVSEDKELNSDFNNGDIFYILLPAGVSWNPDTVVNYTYANVKLVSDRKLEVTMKNCSDGITDTIVLSDLQIKADSNVVGDIELEIDGRDSAVTSSKITSNKVAVQQKSEKYENEIVTILKVFDDFSALIARQNGEQYIIETEVPLGLWSLQKKSVVVLSPGPLFAGPGAYLQVPSGNKSLLIDVNQLNSKITDTQPSKPNVTKVYVNGEEVSFDTEPIIEANVTLVPLRAIMEKLGVDVSYNDELRIITAKKDDKKIYLKIGDKTAKIDDKTVNLQVPAQIINSRTLVPLRFISESIGAKVDYNEQEQIISIQLADIS